jgi:tetratricopeptide (TPR) repeat protein
MLITMLAVQVAAAAVPAETVQAQFDRAAAAAEAGQWETALADFSALEARLQGGKGKANLAIARLRKGGALNALGRYDEARSAIVSGLALLPDLPALKSDRYDAAVILAGVEAQALDYPAATAALKIAQAAAQDDSERVSILAKLVIATMFDADSQALGYADAAIAMASANPQIGKSLMAQLRTLRGRTLLNRQDYSGARAEFDKAIKLQGGLTLKTEQGEVTTRADVATAAMLAKDTETARKYMAYTGAGRITEAPFDRAATMELPQCGGDADIRPDDTVVIEFGIRPDGTVLYAQPVYASRLGPLAVTFARAVAGWSWRPEDVAKIPPFYRTLTRLQLRCTNEMQAPSIYRLLGNDLDAWLRGRGVAPAPVTGKSAPEVETLRRTLAAREAADGSEALALVPVLIALADSDFTAVPDRIAWIARSREILNAAGAPMPMRVAVDARNPQGEAQESVRGYRNRLRALLAEPAVAADARTAAALRLLVAQPDYMRASPPDAEALLLATANDARLPAQDPFRVGAWIRLASLQAEKKNLEAARISFEKSGLQAQQCALVDASPALRSSGVDSSDFPMEAMRWGFEGWVKTEFDITADGKTANQRAVIAYPPFVFENAGINIARGSTWRQSYRPAGDPGCSAKTINIRFRLP